MLGLDTVREGEPLRYLKPLGALVRADPAMSENQVVIPSGMHPWLAMVSQLCRRGNTTISLWDGCVSSLT